MKLPLLALLAGSAAAFAPASQKSSASSALKMSDYSNEIGAIPPVGFFDPLKLSKGISPERFELYRKAELKHGRVAQLAVIGYVVPEFYTWPGTKANEIGNGLAAITDLPLLGWLQIIAFVGAVEYSGFYGDYEIGKPDLPPSVLATRQTQELQHGRLAMLACLELFRHDRYDDAEQLITGFPFLYN